MHDMTARHFVASHLDTRWSSNDHDDATVRFHGGGGGSALNAFDEYFGEVLTHVDSQEMQRKLLNLIQPVEVSCDCTRPGQWGYAGIIRRSLGRDNK